MKHVFLTGMALLIFLASNAQTAIPNAGFENWTVQGSYENPDSWDSPNDVTSSFGKIVVEKEEVYVHGGSYSAMITVLSSIAGNLPGMLTLGDFSFDLMSMTATIEGGTPFTGRPEKMNGWFQYEPQNNDICLVGAFLFKDNSGTWDTIATAGFDTTATVMVWTEFEAVFDYRSSETPTHMNIILLPTDRDNPQANSTLYIDDLSFSYPQAIDESGSNPLRVASNFEDDEIVVTLPDNDAAVIALIDASGRRVSTIAVSDQTVVFDMNGLPAGIYLIHYSNENAVYSIKTIWPDIH